MMKPLMTASFHIVPSDSCQMLLDRLRPKPPEFVHPTAPRLTSVLNSLGTNVFDEGTPTDAVEAAWYYLDQICGLNLQRLSAITPAPKLAELGYRFIYAIPHVVAADLLTQTHELTVDARAMCLRLLELWESDRGLNALSWGRALEGLRLGFEGIGAAQLGLLWLPAN